MRDLAVVEALAIVSHTGPESVSGLSVLRSAIRSANDRHNVRPGTGPALHVLHSAAALPSASLISSRFTGPESVSGLSVLRSAIRSANDRHKACPGTGPALHVLHSAAVLPSASLISSRFTGPESVSGLSVLRPAIRSANDRHNARPGTGPALHVLHSAAALPSASLISSRFTGPESVSGLSVLRSAIRSANDRHNARPGTRPALHVLHSAAALPSAFLISSRFTGPESVSGLSVLRSAIRSANDRHNVRPDTGPALHVLHSAAALPSASLISSRFTGSKRSTEFRPVFRSQVICGLELPNKDLNPAIAANTRQLGSLRRDL